MAGDVGDGDGDGKQWSVLNDHYNNGKIIWLYNYISINDDNDEWLF